MKRVFTRRLDDRRFRLLYVDNLVRASRARSKQASEKIAARRSGLRLFVDWCRAGRWRCAAGERRRRILAGCCRKNGAARRERRLYSGCGGNRSARRRG